MTRIERDRLESIRKKMNKLKAKMIDRFAGHMRMNKPTVESAKEIMADLEALLGRPVGTRKKRFDGKS